MSQAYLFEGAEPRHTVSGHLIRVLEHNLIMDGDWKTSDDTLYSIGLGRGRDAIMHIERSLGARTASEIITGLRIFLNDVLENTRSRDTGMVRKMHPMTQGFYDAAENSLKCYEDSNAKFDRPSGVGAAA